MAQFEMTWEAPEFEYYEKDVSWYWITIIIAALIIAFSVWERNFLFGLFIVIAEILVIMWGNQKPRMVAFTLNENGLEIGGGSADAGSEGGDGNTSSNDVPAGGGKFHSIKEFESWSAAEVGDGLTELGFNFHAKLKVPLKILAPTASLEDIRKNLKLLLREVEHQTSLIEAIEKLLRF